MGYNSKLPSRGVSWSWPNVCKPYQNIDISYLSGILSLPYLYKKHFRTNKIFKYEAKHQNKGKKDDKWSTEAGFWDSEGETCPKGWSHLAWGVWDRGKGKRCQGEHRVMIRWYFW